MIATERQSFRFTVKTFFRPFLGGGGGGGMGKGKQIFFFYQSPSALSADLTLILNDGEETRLLYIF